MAAMQMQIGFTFEQAIKNLGNALQSPLASRYIDLVIQASYSGGSVSNLIQNASVDMGNFLTIEKEKKSGLSQYVVVLYMGQVILIVLCAILVVQFLPQLTSISSIGSIGGGTSNSLAGFLGGASDIGSVPMERDMFFLVYLNGLFGGLVIGKISSGRIKDGIKHSLILLIIALLAWDFYVLPASSSTGPAVQIHVVSYPTSGLAGFKTSQPLVVNVTNSKGAPIPSEVVKFIVAGGGIANPATTPTDSEGEASTVITLSGTPGPDVVLITAGISYATVSINATAGVGNSGS